MELPQVSISYRAAVSAAYAMQAELAAISSDIQLAVNGSTYRTKEGAEKQRQYWCQAYMELARNQDELIKVIS